MTWGDKMTKAEIDDIFGEFEIDEDQGCYWSLRCRQGRGEEGRSTPSSRGSSPCRGRRGRGQEEEEEEEEGCQVNTSSSFNSFPLQQCYVYWRRPARHRVSRGTRIQYSTFHKLLYCIVLLYSQSNTQLQL